MKLVFDILLTRAEFSFFFFLLLFEVNFCRYKYRFKCITSLMKVRNDDDSMATNDTSAT